jgi:hypothetical protein
MSLEWRRNRALSMLAYYRDCFPLREPAKAVCDGTHVQRLQNPTARKIG